MLGEVAILLRAIAAAVFFALLIQVYVLFRLLRPKTSPRPGGHGPGVHGGKDEGGGCSAQTCGAIDPVSDPDYNMREIAKQSILLEEHLTVDNKYCVDCVAKHLLHCVGLANEAVMLACDRIAEYPYAAEAPAFFQGQLDRWLASRKNGTDNRLEMATEVREFRKKLVAAYFTS